MLQGGQKNLWIRAGGRRRTWAAGPWFSLPDEGWLADNPLHTKGIPAKRRGQHAFRAVPLLCCATIVPARLLKRGFRGEPRELRLVQWQFHVRVPPLDLTSAFVVR